ncbi:MAG: hypothetical protein ABJF23_28885 [Bryobacteraceae bacterium]
MHTALAASGLEVAAAIDVLPLRGDEWIFDVEDSDDSHAAVSGRALANVRLVTPAYFQVMGSHRRRGGS